MGADNTFGEENFNPANPSPPRPDTTFPDYSEYLREPGMLPYIESEWRSRPEHHLEQAQIVNGTLDGGNLKLRVLEVGCATGNTAEHLLPCDYTGLDANEECLEIAKAKNPSKSFICGDVRKQQFTEKYQLVYSFAVLKHFSYEEFPEILKKILSFGRVAIFDIPISDYNYDDGQFYHHIWLTKEFVESCIKESGHTVVKILNTDRPEWTFITVEI